MDKVEYPRGYLIEAVATLQNSRLNQAIMLYVCNPGERHLKTIVDYLILESVSGRLKGNFLSAEHDAIKESLDKLEANDRDEWRNYLLAILPMGTDFEAMGLFGPFNDRELEDLAATAPTPQ